MSELEAHGDGTGPSVALDQAQCFVQDPRERLLDGQGQRPGHASYLDVGRRLEALAELVDHIGERRLEPPGVVGQGRQGVGRLRQALPAGLGQGGDAPGAERRLGGIGVLEVGRRLLEHE